MNLPLCDRYSPQCTIARRWFQSLTWLDQFVQRANHSHYSQSTQKYKTVTGLSLQTSPNQSRSWLVGYWFECTTTRRWFQSLTWLDQFVQRANHSHYSQSTQKYKTVTGLSSLQTSHVRDWLDITCATTGVCYHWGATHWDWFVILANESTHWSVHHTSTGTLHCQP